MSLNNSITVQLLESINPSIDKACDNIVPGLYYCVLPTASWNSTNSNASESTSGTATTETHPAPGPTPSGTIGTCHKWHLVKAGEYCYLINQQEGISMGQLMAWNPSLKADCSNLVKGDA